jgi:SulP family sulfate permease
MDPPAVLTHVLVALSLSALFTGVLLYGLGRAQAGTAIRYIPYPLIGGFLAATGWLMMTGAVRVVTDVSLGLGNLDAFRNPARAAQLAVTVLFAVIVATALTRVRHFLTLPLILVVSVTAVHVVLLALGRPLETYRQAGWFFDTSGNGGLAGAWLPAALPGIEWSALVPSAAALIGVMVVTSISILLNATGLEVSTGVDVDLNRELRSQGYANLASAATGGFIGYLSLTRSYLNHRAGAESRTAGVVVAAICLAGLFAGPMVVGYIPKFVLGGLLLYMGGSLLFEWGVKSWRRLSAVDYAMVVGILVVTVRWGFVNAVFVGLIAGCIIFAFNYSRVHFVKHEFTGKEFRSAVERPKEERLLLALHGERIRVLLLQGYLFFGSANRLYSRVRDELRRGETGDRRFLILDFGLVSGIDSSAIVSFTKIARAAAAAAADLLLTGLSPGVEKALRGAGLLDGAASRIRTFADVDRAMEWCEGETLETGRSSRDARLVTREWHEWLADELGNAALADLLATYLEKVDRPSGEHVCHQGEPSDAIYFVESGRISILLEREGGAPVRLRSMTGRTVIGEIGFYLGEPRSASVVADDPSIIHSLTRDGFGRMLREHPELASGLNAMIVRLLAERLTFANRLIDALQR